MFRTDRHRDDKVVGEKISITSWKCLRSWNPRLSTFIFLSTFSRASTFEKFPCCPRMLGYGVKVSYPRREYMEESPELERSGSTGGGTKSRRSNLLTQMCQTTGARESYCKISAA